MTHPYFETNEPFESFDFNSLDLEKLDQSIELALKESKKQLLSLVETTEVPTFENTIVALESLGENLELVTNVMYNLFSAHTSDKTQTLMEKWAPSLSNHTSEILLNEELFHKVKSVYESAPQLDGESQTLLDKTFRSFTQNGALLSKEDKEVLREIDQKLSQLSPAFSKNSLEATNNFKWSTTNVAELKGLKEAHLEAAKEEAKAQGLPEGTYAFTLQYPSLLPILKYADNRSLREAFYRANSSKAVSGEFSNQKNILDIIELRHKKANLLGFENYADFILQERMAKNSNTVFEFLNDFKKHCLDKAKNEMEELKKFSGLSDFSAWDLSYYMEKLRKKKFDISDEETKPYFSLDKVLGGAFLHAKKLYGLTFKKNDKVTTYHEEVTPYEVWEEDKFVGLFYTDFFPRASKRSGAWCTHFKNQGLFKGKRQRPHVSIVCNFTKPTTSKPSLLTYDEVRTLFHEFGHALHELLSQCTYRSVAGTNVYWDFVELPSQIMENWTLEKESLQLFAHHHETGEPLPEEKIEKLKVAQTFMSGYQNVRQLTFGFLDMKWHTTPPLEIKDVIGFENQATEELRLLEKLPESNASCAFEHIFSGGYAAGYYSYKWAEVLDADAFESFLEEGLFNPEVATKFKKEILEKGGTDHPENLYVNFKGRKPSVDALLKRDNLI